MNNTTVSFVSIFFVLHGIQNILLYFGLKTITPPEAIGGIFSFVCAYLIARKAFVANFAVLLRCLGGLFSIATVIHVGSGNIFHISFLSALSTWPLVFFSITGVLMLVSFEKPKVRDSRIWNAVIMLFIAVMFSNWVWSFRFAIESLRQIHIE